MVQEVWHLHFPPWPVMIDIMAPVIEPAFDTFICKNFLQSAGAVQHHIFPSALTNTNNDIAVVILIDIEVVITSETNIWNI